MPRLPRLTMHCTPKRQCMAAAMDATAAAAAAHLRRLQHQVIVRVRCIQVGRVQLLKVVLHPCRQGRGRSHMGSMSSVQSMRSVHNMNSIGSTPTGRALRAFMRHAAPPCAAPKTNQLTIAVPVRLWPARPWCVAFCTLGTRAHRPALLPSRPRPPTTAGPPLQARPEDSGERAGHPPPPSLPSWCRAHACVHANRQPAEGALMPPVL